MGADADADETSCCSRRAGRTGGRSAGFVVGFLRGSEWIVPCQPTVDGRFADASVSYSLAVRMVLEETQSPIVFGALLAKLGADSPDAPIEAIEGMLTELVRLGVLVSSLRLPTAITDPLAYI